MALLFVGATAQTVHTDTLGEVVVTGTGTSHLLKNEPVHTEVISSQMLKSYNGKSLEDILGGLTSSFAFNEDDMGSQMQMGGLGNNYILILIDGKRIHGDVGGENDLSLIDPANIERIEIVRGASSALYGSDAIAGVINIITKKPKEQGLLIENTTRIGSHGDIRQHDGLSFNYGRFTSQTNFQLQHSDGWQNTGHEYTSSSETPITDSRNKTVNRHTNWQLSERLTFKASERLELYGEGMTYHKRIYRPQDGKYARFDVYTYDLEYDNQSAAAGGRLKLNTTDYITFDLDYNRHAYSYRYTDYTLVEDYTKSAGTIYYPYFPYLTGQKGLQSDQRRTMANVKGVFNLPMHNMLSVGGEYRYDWLNAPDRVERGKVNDWTGALFVQDEFTHINRLNITAGLRLNGNKQFGFRMTPKVSIMYTPTSDLRLRATWSQGFKTPTNKELHYRYVRQMSGTYLYLGNTELKPQTSNYISVNGEYTIGRLELSLTAYYNKVVDMISLVTIPNYLAPDRYIAQYDPIKTRQYQNIDDARTTGIDFSFRYSWKELTAGGSYSYLDTKANQYDTNHDRMHSVVIDGMAHHKAYWFATWSHHMKCGSAYGFGLYGRMSSKRYYQINGNGKGYQTWRINAHYEPVGGKSLSYRIDAGIDNIFGYIDRTPHGLHLGTTTAGRTFYVSCNIKFNKGKRVKNNYKSNFKSNQENEEN